VYADILNYYAEISAGNSTIVAEKDIYVNELNTTLIEDGLDNSRSEEAFELIGNNTDNITNSNYKVGFIKDLLIDNYLDIPQDFNIIEILT
jgi:hypothetical protein